MFLLTDADTEVRQSVTATPAAASKIATADAYVTAADAAVAPLLSPTRAGSAKRMAAN